MAEFSSSTTPSAAPQQDVSKTRRPRRRPSSPPGDPANSYRARARAHAYEPLPPRASNNALRSVTSLQPLTPPLTPSEATDRVLESPLRLNLVNVVKKKESQVDLALIAMTGYNAIARRKGSSSLDKPLPEAPESPRTATTSASPFQIARSLLDAYEHPPPPSSSGTGASTSTSDARPSEQSWFDASPERDTSVGQDTSEIMSTLRKESGSGVLPSGLADTSSKLSTPVLTGSTWSNSSPVLPTPDRAEVATVHKATMVITRRPSAHSMSPAKNVKRHRPSSRSISSPIEVQSVNSAPTLRRSSSDPLSPPLTYKEARVVQLPHGSTLKINSHADRVIFGAPMRKPTFNELRNLNHKRNKSTPEKVKVRDGTAATRPGTAGSVDHGMPLTATESIDQWRRRGSIPVSVSEMAEQEDVEASVAAFRRPDFDDKHETDRRHGRSKSINTTPTKTRRSPSPHANTLLNHVETTPTKASSRKAFRQIDDNKENETMSYEGSMQYPTRTHSLSQARHKKEEYRNARPTAVRGMYNQPTGDPLPPMPSYEALGIISQPDTDPPSPFEKIMKNAKEAIANVKQVDPASSGSSSGQHESPVSSRKHSLTSHPAFRNQPDASTNAFSEHYTLDCLTRSDTRPETPDTADVPLPRSRSRSRKMITNLRDMFTRRPSDQKGTQSRDSSIPPSPARNPLTRNVTPPTPSGTFGRGRAPSKPQRSTSDFTPTNMLPTSRHTALRQVPSSPLLSFPAPPGAPQQSPVSRLISDVVTTPSPTSKGRDTSYRSRVAQGNLTSNSNQAPSSQDPSPLSAHPITNQHVNGTTDPYKTLTTQALTLITIAQSSSTSTGSHPGPQLDKESLLSLAQTLQELATYAQQTESAAQNAQRKADEAKKAAAEAIRAAREAVGAAKMARDEAERGRERVMEVGGWVESVLARSAV